MAWYIIIMGDDRVHEKLTQYHDTYDPLYKKALAMAGNTQDYISKTEVSELFDKKPAAVNDEYVVFITISNGQDTHVQMGSSPKTPQVALKAAQAKLPRKTNNYPYIKLDIVTGVRRFEEFNYFQAIKDTPGPFYGIALDWEKEWVFLPDEVLANAMVDANEILRLEHIATYARGKRKLNTWALPEYNDDTPIVEVLDVFHTESIFMDLDPADTMYSVSLYHGHQLFPRITPELVFDAAKEAGAYLSSAVKETGRMVYKYNPRSDYEPFGYSLARHAGTIYSMACLYKVAPNDFLLESMKLSMNYLTAQIQDCPIPYKKDEHAKCLIDYEHDNHAISKLDANALTVLAIVEYLHATKENNDHFIDMAKGIATFIMGSQRDNGSFCQKIRLNGAHGTELDEEYFVGYALGEVAFALARLHKILDNNEAYLVTATTTTAHIVAQESKVDDANFRIDHWLLLGIAELPNVKNTFMDYAMRSVKVARHFQSVEAEDDEELDLIGIYYDDMSVTATATKAEGLCALYELAVANGKTEEAALILESTTLSVSYQLQAQYRPEKAIYMKDPNRILGGFHETISESKMRIDYTQHNLSSLLCMKHILELTSKKG